MDFPVKGEHIELVKLLKVVGFFPSGGEAKMAVAASQVKVNGEVELRKRRKLVVGDRIEVQGEGVRLVEYPK